MENQNSVFININFKNLNIPNLKKILNHENLLITLITCLCISNVFGQVNSSFSTQATPQAISYKAIAYDSTGQALVSQTITLRSGILKGSETGLLEFQETHEVVTSEDGYFSIKIGEGIRTGGVQLEFKDINWGADQYFLKMEIDAAGGYNFGDAGTEKICSVPYSFKSAVADSLSGMSKDSLIMILNGVSSTCTCTLQDAYDNGNVIIVNAAIGPVNFIGNNSGISFQVLRVDGTGSFNNDLSYFYNANSSNTNASIWARTNGIGQGIFVQSDNTTPQINTALSVVQNNIGAAARFNNNLNSTGHNNQRNVIEVLQGGVSIGGTGTAHGGYFTIQNNTSTAAAVRGEIGNFTLADHRSSAHAQAGSFLINMADNDVTSLSAQTVGVGGAATFLNSKISNSAPVVSIQHNGIGNGGNFTINNTNSSGTGILVTNNGGGNDFVTNHSSANGSGGSINITNASNTNTGFSINHAGSNGNVFMVNQTNPTSNGFGILSNFGGSNGGAAQFITNNTNFLVLQLLYQIQE
ncbi:MAG: hypothetical protein IPP71_13035 [Bacteroidetes bacterium]|nr:hypothetical protein [Bacteroidota bacterium]